MIIGTLAIFLGCITVGFVTGSPLKKSVVLAPSQQNQYHQQELDYYGQPHMDLHQEVHQQSRDDHYQHHDPSHHLYDHSHFLDDHHHSHSGDANSEDNNNHHHTGGGDHSHEVPDDQAHHLGQTLDQNQQYQQGQQQLGDQTTKKPGHHSHHHHSQQAGDNTHHAGDNTHHAGDNTHHAGDNTHHAGDNTHHAGDNPSQPASEDPDSNSHHQGGHHSHGHPAEDDLHLQEPLDMTSPVKNADILGKVPVKKRGQVVPKSPKPTATTPTIPPVAALPVPQVNLGSLLAQIQSSNPGSSPSPGVDDFASSIKKLQEQGELYQMINDMIKAEAEVQKLPYKVDAPIPSPAPATIGQPVQGQHLQGQQHFQQDPYHIEEDPQKYQSVPILPSKSVPTSSSSRRLRKKVMY